ncbi:MAG: biotin--[acetyl-CoA-carboxylase] ligase [Gemmatimonadota bacterium]|nr:biotin--[acetyl-CoA-carboxylase] ligase [Gemmatimonadota bacterium]
MNARKAPARWSGLTAAELAARWGRPVHLRGDVPSTNDVARELATDGAPEGSVVLARSQTAGRGRSGHAWHSPRDAGVYASLLARPHDLFHPAPLTILAGLEIVERLAKAFPGLGPMLKWPNDLMAGDGKLGGLLAEATWRDGQPQELVIGVGVNVRPPGPEAPAEVRARAVSIDERTGTAAALVDVADAVVEGVAAAIRIAGPVLGSEQLERVDRYDWLRDRRCRLRLPDETEAIGGTSVGIAPDGALLFRPDRGGLRRVPLGTVEAE